jgi:hypothetical protein
MTPDNLKVRSEKLKPVPDSIAKLFADDCLDLGLALDILRLPREVLPPIVCLEGPQDNNICRASVAA